MKAKNLVIAALVAGVIFLGYNVAIDRLARTSYRQQARAAVEHLPATTKVVFLGNSLVEAGCDVTAFVDGWPTASTRPVTVNLGLGATTPVEHYLLLKHALENGVRPKYLIYGFFDDQLNVNPRGEWSDLVGNRALSYYYPADSAELYDSGSFLKKLQLDVTRRIPVLAERSSLWTKVEHWRRSCEEVGMPKQKTNRFGRVADFGALAPTDVSSFNSRCSAILKAHAPLATAVQKIVNLAHQYEITVIFVEMPMPEKHRKAFYASDVWPKMREHLQQLVREAHANYIVASDWVADEDKFEDAMHLNEQGARVFSARLAKVLSQEETQTAVVADAGGR